MVIGAPGKPTQVEDDDVLDFAFVDSTILQQFLKFGPVHGLRRLAGVLKFLQYLNSVLLAVFAAGPAAESAARGSGPALSWKPGSK